MMRTIFLILPVLLSMGFTAPASADDWAYEVSPYLWMPNFQATEDGDVSNPPDSGNLAFDTKTSLEAGFLIYTAARKDRHKLSFEFDWIDASTGAATEFPMFPTAEID